LAPAISENINKKRCGIFQPKDRKHARAVVHHSLGLSIPGFAPISMDVKDNYTMAQGYTKRLFRDHPVPKDPAKFERYRLFCRDLARTMTPIVKMDLEEYLEGTSFNEERKQQYRVAADKTRGPVPAKRYRKKIKSFGKRENYPMYKHARSINSRCDEWKAWAAPYIKPIEQQVFKMSWFIKHTPVKDRPAMINRLNQATMTKHNSDYSAYESHFIHEDYCMMEAASVGELFNHMLSNYPEARKCIIKTDLGINTMSTREGLVAWCRARRMSGELWTSLGNGWANMCMARFLAQEKGYTIDGYVEGDDGIFMCSGALTKQDFADMGMTCDIQQFQSVNEASFCGIIATDANEIIRDPIEFMAKFGWSTHFINCSFKTKRELLRAKALSTLYETPQCPIVAKLAHKALELTKDYAPRFVDDGYHKTPTDITNVVDFKPDESTRGLMHKVFHIDRGQQILIEKYIDEGAYEKIRSVLTDLNPAQRQQLDDMDHYAARYLIIAG